MALVPAITCDTPNCLAAHLGDTPFIQCVADPEYTAALITAAVRDHGWAAQDGSYHCPSCARRKRPVLERGECRSCMGRVHSYDVEPLERCVDCGSEHPYIEDDEFDPMPESTP